MGILVLVPLFGVCLWHDCFFLFKLVSLGFAWLSWEISNPVNHRLTSGELVGNMKSVWDVMLLLRELDMFFGELEGCAEAVIAIP